jgi:glutathione S-transferase
MSGRKLLSFAPMIDSEFARFVLAHYGIAYVEERHLFGWASLLSLVRGASFQIPLLYGEGPALAGPERIVAHFEPLVPPASRLIPEDGMLAAQVAADMQRYHGTLGDQTAVIGYYHLLPQKALMMEPFTRGIPPGEARVLASIYPAFAGLFNLLLRLNAAHAADALDQTRLLFEEVDRRLADGRAFLVGDRLTLSDIALATAAAPVLLPENYGSPMPPLDAMPSALKAIVEELRQHPTAHFVSRIFREHRRNP